MVRIASDEVEKSGELGIADPPGLWFLALGDPVQVRKDILRGTSLICLSANSPKKMPADGG